MNIKTGNGMGLKPKGMQLKPSNGMGIKTGNGMGLTNSKGMGLASDQNYFKFNEYNRMRRYLFGAPGKKKQDDAFKPKHLTAGDKSQNYKAEAKPPREPQPNPHRKPEPSRTVAQRRLTNMADTKPVVIEQASPWQPRSRDHKHGRQVGVFCDCFFCQMDMYTHIRW